MLIVYISLEFMVYRERRERAPPILPNEEYDFGLWELKLVEKPVEAEANMVHGNHTVKDAMLLKSHPSNAPPRQVEHLLALSASISSFCSPNFGCPVSWLSSVSSPKKGHASNFEREMLPQHHLRATQKLEGFTKTMTIKAVDN